MAILADGQVSTTKATIYTVTGGGVLNSKGIKLEKVSVFNTNVLAQTILLFVTKRGGTSRELRQFVLLHNEGGEYLEPGEFLALDFGDIIQAITTTAGATDFVVFGEDL